MDTPAKRLRDIYAKHAFVPSKYCGRCGFLEDLSDCLNKAMHSKPFVAGGSVYQPHPFRRLDECNRCGFEKANGNVHQ